MIIAGIASSGSTSKVVSDKPADSRQSQANCLEMGIERIILPRWVKDYEFSPDRMRSVPPGFKSLANFATLSL